MKFISLTKIFERILNLENAFVSENTVFDSLSKSMWIGKKRLLCKHCGFSHECVNYRFKDLSCNFYKKKGNIRKVCREANKVGIGSSNYSDRSTHKSKFDESDKQIKDEQKKKFFIRTVADEDNSAEEAGNNSLLSVTTVHAVNKEEFNFIVNWKLVPFEIDSGAAVSTLSKYWALALDLQIEPCSKRLNAYGNVQIKVLGKVVLDITYNQFNICHTLYVVDSHNSNLCGKDLMAKVGIYLASIDEFSKVNNVDNAADLLANYSVASSQPISSIVAKIHVNSNAAPKFIKARTVHYYYKPTVETDLK